MCVVWCVCVVVLVQPLAAQGLTTSWPLGFTSESWSLTFWPHTTIITFLPLPTYSCVGTRHVLPGEGIVVIMERWKFLLCFLEHIELAMCACTVVLGLTTYKIAKLSFPDFSSCFAHAHAFSFLEVFEINHMTYLPT